MRREEAIRRLENLERTLPHKTEEDMRNNKALMLAVYDMRTVGQLQKQRDDALEILKQQIQDVVSVKSENEQPSWLDEALTPEWQEEHHKLGFSSPIYDLMHMFDEEGTDG